MSEFKFIRKSILKLSQAELGAKLGVTQATISRLETGEQKSDERTRLALEHLVEMTRNEDVSLERHDSATTAIEWPLSGGNAGDFSAPAERQAA